MKKNPINVLRFVRVCACLLTVLVTCSISGCGKASSEPKRQVILIVLDAARADRFGYAGYHQNTTPHMDRLAAQGMVFENHFSHDTATRSSLPNLMYSRYFVKKLFPASALVPMDAPEALMRKFDDESISLPKALEKGGFATAAISAHSWIRHTTLLGRQFQELQDLSSILKRHSPSAEEVVTRAVKWISDNKSKDYFLYLHMMDTHFPHAFGEDAKRFWDSRKNSRKVPTRAGQGKDSTRASAGKYRRLDARYDGSLCYADRQIGRLIGHLKEQRLFKDTLIVITSDHGEHLREVPNRFLHGGSWYDPVSHIPLLVSYPAKIKPARVEAFSGLVDVAPTILGVLDVGLAPGKLFDGIDLVDAASGVIPEREFIVSRHGIRDKRYKVIFESEKGFLEEHELDEKTKGKLFDLVRDPLEVNNIWDKKPKKIKTLFKRYQDTLKTKFARYINAVNHEQPTLPFAIAANHFKSETKIIKLPHQSINLRNLNKLSSHTDWVRWTNWKHHWLLGRKSSGKIDIFFPLPNGKYEVTASVRGSGRIRIGEGDPVEVKEKPFALRLGIRFRQVKLGVTQVQNELFRATLASDENAVLWIDMLGFRPVVKQSSAPGLIEDEHLKQLKALGYIK